MRLTSRADAKAGLSDPVLDRGIGIAQRIKGTPGITGLSGPRVHNIELRIRVILYSKVAHIGETH